ncbi:hypothetical protein HPB50_001476 [Hyalomma asiaticum]|uniref:Uncharacterized protein n=1 Tax=Hyalomma asiaticum TaxID=266040 RepID=A0ACB7TD06_HYAAI|nr:hypothetical protein HPB50_001476 [Hyalomma asiaticum]
MKQTGRKKFSLDGSNECLDERTRLRTTNSGRNYSGDVGGDSFIQLRCLSRHNRDGSATYVEEDEDKFLSSEDSVAPTAPKALPLDFARGLVVVVAVRGGPQRCVAFLHPGAAGAPRQEKRPRGKSARGPGSVRSTRRRRWRTTSMSSLPPPCMPRAAHDDRQEHSGSPGDNVVRAHTANSPVCAMMSSPHLYLATHRAREYTAASRGIVLRRLPRSRSAILLTLALF